MPKFLLSYEFMDRVEKIVGRKFTRGGQKMMIDCINILETKISQLEAEQNG